MSTTASPAAPPTLQPSLDRRRLLAAAGLGGLATAAASGEAYAAPGLDPMDLSFDIVDTQRPRDLVADRFVELRDRFGGRGPRYTVLSPSDQPGRVRRRDGRLEIGGRDPHFTLLRSTTGQRAPYASVVVQVASMSGDDERDRVYAGLVADAGDHVLAWYDAATGRAGIDVSVDGVVTELGSAEAPALTGGFRMAFSLTSSTVVVFVEGGEGLQPLVQARLDDHVDLRRPALLARYRNGFGAESGSGRTELAAVEAGYFGELGLRDPHLVTRADGTPYLRDGKAYLTFTQAGLAFFETAHWGVWTLDLRTFELEQVANLFFRREGLDAVLGDHAGHLVLDERNDRWIVTNSTWGDFSFEGVEINYTTVSTRRDLLSGVHVLRTRRLPLPLADLPSEAVGQWDPHVVRIRGRWYVAFVNARAFFNFYPALARSARGADFDDGLRLVGADADKVETEGTVMQKFGDSWYVLASNGDASPEEIRGQYPVYDLQMDQVGVLDAPHPTNIPWPMVIPVPTRNGRTRWLIVTFNGTQFEEPLLGYGTHGDVVVMEADRTTRGRQFPRR
ncbi:hypothetical protein [Nocardioides dongkuii]|uniref:hypothetical protein n=1 Tax=Nocardioides dongkuii TaxID=2760089 RepID=UPI0015F7D78E|nr:hypothetical protein [Nocardioides dongkuii]